MTLNSNGTLLAMGTVNGTKVKIFNTVDGQCLRKLARGNTHCKIRHLCFSLSSALISLTSQDKQTVHVWRTGLETHAGSEGPQAPQRTIFERVVQKIKREVPNDHLMWQVAPLQADKCGKLCGFNVDETGLRVATEDARFFEIAFSNMGEMQGCDLISGEPLELV